MANQGEQMGLTFSKNTIKNIHIFREAPESESKNINSGCKLTASQQIAIKAICNEHNMPVSGFIYDAVENWIDFFPYRKILKHHKFRRWLREAFTLFSTKFDHE